MDGLGMGLGAGGNQTRHFIRCGELDILLERMLNLISRLGHEFQLCYFSIL